MINGVVSNIPIVMAHLFDDIIVVRKETDELYSVKYDGKKGFIGEREPYDSINRFLTNEEISILNKDGRFLTSKHYIYVQTVEDFKIILISKIKEEEYREDRETLLIADDSPIITNFFKKIFEDRYDVLVAKDGNEAIDLIEKNKDKRLLGVFLDLAMPVSSGYDVLEYFKNNNLFKEIPVSIISGDDSQEGIGKATSYAIIDMLQKPFSKEAAEAIVGKTIGFSPKK